MPVKQKRTTIQLTVKLEFDIDPSEIMNEAAIANSIVEAAREAAPGFCKVNDIFALRNCDLEWKPAK